MTPNDYDIEPLLKTVASVTGVHRHFIRHGGHTPYFVQARAVALLVLRRAGYGWRRCGHALNRSPSALIGLARTYERTPIVARDVERVSEIHGLQKRTPHTSAKEPTR